MITCGCNSTVSDRNKPGVTSQNIMEFLQLKTLLALFSTLCSLLHRSSSHIAAIQGKDRCTWTCWLFNVILGVLCFLINDYYKIIDMFLDHTPWAGSQLTAHFLQKDRSDVSNPSWTSGQIVMFLTHARNVGESRLYPVLLNKCRECYTSIALLGYW